MEQVQMFRTALATALDEGSRRRQLRLQVLIDENPELAGLAVDTVTSAVLAAARAGEAETSVVLGSHAENEIASEFLRRVGLPFTFNSRTADDVRKYPELAGFALRIQVAYPRGN